MVRIFDGLARQKNLRLLLTFNPPPSPVDVVLDPLRFKQVLSNLVSNAIKFTEQGEVRITVDLFPADEAGQAQMQVQVQDSGVGISAQDQQRLFQPFAQADNTCQLARGGAGLGLVISRSLCEMMGGHLQLSSQPGVGTLVSVSLQLATLPPEQAREPSEPRILTGAPPLSVLVVDDHPANRLLMCQQLEYLGHRFTGADDGRAGLKAWKNGAFDLVVVDCNMPIMNGYDLARAIRQHEQQHQQPPCTVLGFTANAQPEEVQRCKLAGMNDCLFKPLSLTVLSQWVEGLGPPLRQPPFNLEGLDLLTGGNPELAGRLMAELLSSSRLDRQELLALSADKDPQALIDVAHKIKGAARIAQASRLIECCEALEKACHDSAPTRVVTRCKNAMDQAMLELEQALMQQIGLNDDSRMTEP